MNFAHHQIFLTLLSIPYGSIKFREKKVNRGIEWQENDSHRIYLDEEMTLINRCLYWLVHKKRAADKLNYIWFVIGRELGKKSIATQ